MCQEVILTPGDSPNRFTSTTKSASWSTNEQQANNLVEGKTSKSKGLPTDKGLATDKGSKEILKM